MEGEKTCLTVREPCSVGIYVCKHMCAHASSPLSQCPIGSYLLAANWHTTVFIGARDKIRSKGYWPKDLLLDVPQDEVLELLTDKLRKFDLQCTPPYRMKVSSVGRTNYSINMQLTPETAEEEGRLKDLRNRLSNYLVIRHPQHDSFTFHLTLAYLLRWLDDGQKQELDALLQEHFETMPAQMELDRPTFCTFQNMKGWSPVLELKNL
jgi:hypothetical protein